MRGIVIAGGLGTRLRPLTLTRPKPLMPLVNAPLLEYQLSYLRKAGITEVCFATNYMADAVERHFGDGSRYGMKLVYAIEDEPLGTGGAIRNAYDALPPGDCAVFNGDTIHAFDIAAIIRRHLERGADATLTLIRVDRPHPYGVVPLNGEGRVQGFLEPSDEQKRGLNDASAGGTDNINAGLYVLTARVLDSFPQGPSSVEHDVFPRIIEEGRGVFGDVQEAYWIDIGRPVQYLEAVRAVIAGEVGAARPIRVVGGCAVDKTAEIHEEAQVSDGTSVGPHVRIGRGAVVTGSILLKGVEVGCGARIERSVVDEGSRIGANATVRDAVLEANAVVPDQSVVSGQM
ncbi:MAG: NDP-sugar synthase [Armatimonadetes bacterium]|nr:NDP-sugar synthase [Armatimonadota bacterium]